MHDGHGWRDESEVEFVEATRDRVWSLTVRTQRGVVGHIFRAANGDTALFTDHDLERVKERVQHFMSRLARRGRSAWRLAGKVRVALLIGGDRDRSVTIRWTFRVRTAHDIFGFADGRTLRPKGDLRPPAS